MQSYETVLKTLYLVDVFSLLNSHCLSICFVACLSPLTFSFDRIPSYLDPYEIKASKL
jgi:hypothetical protein